MIFVITDVFIAFDTFDTNKKFYGKSDGPRADGSSWLSMLPQNQVTLIIDIIVKNKVLALEMQN